MSLRVSMLLAVLSAGVVHGQTAAPTQPAPAPGSMRPGAAPTRATGLPPSSPGLSGTGASTGPLGNANGTNNSSPAASKGNANGNPSPAANNGGNTQPPAPVATGSVQVTGRPSANRGGSMDHPLLPIVTAGNALGIRSGTPIRVRLSTAIDSGHARNGDMIEGTLEAPVGNMPAGAPVRLTVVQSVPAGRLYSFGELSVQVVSIADHNVLSDTITAQGKEGAKELPDAAPARGTEATFTPDQPITLPAA